MKKILLFTWIIAILLAGCQSPITDVGNPTVNSLPANQDQQSPSSSQLIGSYEKGTSVASATADALPECQNDANATKQILSGTKAGQVVLENFFSYSASAKQITADYNDGKLFIDLADNTVDISCEGVAVFVGSSVAVGLECDLIKPVKQKCTIAFTKKL